MGPFSAFADPAAYAMSPLWHHGAHSYVNSPRYAWDDDSCYTNEDPGVHQITEEANQEYYNHIDPGQKPWDAQQEGTPLSPTTYDHNLLPFQAGSRSSIRDDFFTCSIHFGLPQPNLSEPNHQRSFKQSHSKTYRDPSPFNECKNPTARYTHRDHTRRNAVSEPCLGGHLDPEDHRSRIPAHLPSLSCRVADEDEDEEDHPSPISPTHSFEPTSPLSLGCRRVSLTQQTFYSGFSRSGRIPSPVYGLPSVSHHQQRGRLRDDDQLGGGAWLDLQRRRERLERRLGRVEEKERRLRRLGAWDE